MIWIALSNTNNCRIYHYDRSNGGLRLEQEIEHPELKLKTSEALTTDKPGHYQAGESARGNYSPHTDVKQAKYDEFAREIAEALDKGRTLNAYQKLILIAPPRMQGYVNQHLNKHVESLVSEVIPKDLHHLSEKELLTYLKETVVL